MKEAVRQVGLLGAGNIATWHAQALATLDGVEVVAVCDQNRRRADAFAARHHIAHAYGALEDMMAKHVLDVVHVLLPPDRHLAAASTVLTAGVNVYLEKPMCVSTQECEELIERARERGCVVGVSHNYLFWDIYEQLRSDVREGALGHVEQVTITRDVEHGMLRSGPFDAWMFRNPRNIMLEIGPHTIGQMLDLVGTPEDIDVKVTDAIELPGGRLFYRRWYINCFMGSASAQLRHSFNPGFADQTIRVRGSIGGATVDFDHNTYLLHRHTRYGVDSDRYFMLSREARNLRRQARRNLLRYVLSIFRLSGKGNAFRASIAAAARAFYRGLPDDVDPRLSPGFALEIVRLCERIGKLGHPAAPQRSTIPGRSPSPSVVGGGAADVLVLGGTGFIGRELVRQLAATGRSVRLLTRDPSRAPRDLDGHSVEVVKGDMTNPADVARAIGSARYVYHLARAMVKTWEDYCSEDVMPTRRIAEACLERGVERLIYTGSIASYYSGRKAGTITEETPLDPRISRRQYYARAKAAAEKILMALHRERELPVVIFRPGIVLGRGGSPFHSGIGMWSWNTVCMMWGNGTSKLPIVLVEDVAAALITALDTDGIDGESFNVVAEPCLTRLDYLHEFERCAGIQLDKLPTAIWRFYLADMFKWVIKCLVRYPDRRLPSYRDWESRAQLAHYDCSKARQLLGWQPTDDRDEIIRRGIHEPVAEFFGLPCA